MSYTIQPNDLVEMDKYFQSRADSIKSAMLTAVPWMLTIAIGLISFGVKEGLLSTGVVPAKPLTATIMGLVSSIISYVALVITKEFCEHIILNWVKAAKAVQYLKELKEPNSFEEHPYITINKLDPNSEEFKSREMTGIMRLMIGSATALIYIALALIGYSIFSIFKVHLLKLSL